jgi:predicted dehydrogenase
MFQPSHGRVRRMCYTQSFMALHSLLIIGCGSIGERHLRCFQKTGRAHVTACDANATLLQAMADTYQVPTTNDWEKALTDQKFDSVVICTPAHLHVAMATRVLQHGCHVLIEKPLSQSLAGIEELARMHASSGKQAAVAYVLHVYPLLLQAREFLRSGELGALRHVTVTSGQYFPGGRPAHTAHYSQTYYRDRKTGGGAIQDALTHTVNWVESVIGRTDSVLCDCAHQVLPGVTVEDTVNVSTRNGDILVNYTLNQFQAPNESTLQFNTEAGSLKIEVHRRRWGTFFLGDSDWKWRDVAPLDRDGPFLAQANAFLDQIEGQPSRLCSLSAAIDTLRFNLAALASADAGTRVHCARVIA